jgi:4-amino-4-deoxy-L-arabinose transferase-like glycosyltransferase
MKPKAIILSCIILLSLVLRLLFLNIIPVGINNDELHFVMNAKSIFYGFSNIEGTINPFKLSEVSSFIFAPVIGPLPNNLFTARLPYALIGSLSVALIYLITLRLSKNPNLALISALVAAINPWGVYVSRTSFDPPVAIFFYLLTIYLLSLTKPKYLLLSIVTGFLAFYSYIGTKVIYFPIITISSYFLWKFNHQKNRRLYLIVVAFSFLLTLNFALSLSSQLVGDRISEIQTPNSQTIKDQVNLERRQSLQIPIIKEALTNKYTVYLNNFIQKYLYNFSTDILFLNGDHAFTGSLWRHGYFYYIDALFVLLGLIYLYTSYPKFLALLASLILLSPIPEAIRASTALSYVFHSSFQFPLLCIIIAAGILFFWQLLSHKFLKLAFVLVYLLSFVNFFDIYFFKAPIYQPEAFVFSQRLLSKYLNLESQHDREIYVLTQEPEVLFRSYLFYTNYYQKDKYSLIKNIYAQSTNSFTLDNLHFINHQQYLPNGDNFTLIYQSVHFSLQKEKSTLYISNLADAGNIYTINRGLTCQDSAFSTYPNNIGLKDLNLDKISETDFCQKYISIKP